MRASRAIRLIKVSALQHVLSSLFHTRSVQTYYCCIFVGNFNAEQSINEEDNNQLDEPLGFLSTFTNFFKSFVAKKVDITAMVCGNALLSGEHHNIYFQDGTVNEEEEYCILCDSMKFIDKESKVDKPGIRPRKWRTRAFCLLHGPGRHTTDKCCNMISSAKKLKLQGNFQHRKPPPFSNKKKTWAGRAKDHQQSIKKEVATMVKEAVEYGACKEMAAYHKKLKPAPPRATAAVKQEPTSDDELPDFDFDLLGSTHEESDSESQSSMSMQAEIV